MAATAALVVGGAVAFLRLSGTASDPQTTASAVLSDLGSGSYTQVCSLAPPVEITKCQGDLSQLPAHQISYISLGLGTVTQSGDRALAVLTGTVCEAGQCVSNHDGNVATDKGQTFDQAFTSAAGSSSSSPFVLPLVEINGTWYVTGF